MNRSGERLEAACKCCKIQLGAHWPHGAALVLSWLLVLAGFTQAQLLIGAPLSESTNPSAGPTLHLDYGRGQALGNPLADFMYFVALISPEPVSLSASPGNTQRARVLSAKSHTTARTFRVTCEFEFAGEGFQRNVFDHSETIRRHERELKAGGSLDQQLGAISVEGAGKGTIEIEGTLTDHVPTVNEVRLRFGGHGQPSPVTISLADIHYRAGAFQPRNEMVARVSTLTFRRKAGPTKMDVTVASVKRKDAGNGFWQNLIGDVKGAAANLLIPPVDVEPVGHAAMLDFGKALAAKTPEFTFPRAKNFKKAD